MISGVQEPRFKTAYVKTRTKYMKFQWNNYPPEENLLAESGIELGTFMSVVIYNTPELSARIFEVHFIFKCL